MIVKYAPRQDELCCVTVGQDGLESQFWRWPWAICTGGEKELMPGAKASEAAWCDARFGAREMGMLASYLCMG